MEEKDAGTIFIALARGKAFCFCTPFIVGASVKERPSGGANNFCAGYVEVRRIFDVWKSINCTFARFAEQVARKRTAVQGAFEIEAEYFDDLDGLSKSHLFRVLQI